MKTMPYEEVKKFFKEEINQPNNFPANNLGYFTVHDADPVLDASLINGAIEGPFAAMQDKLTAELAKSAVIEDLPETVNLAKRRLGGLTPPIKIRINH